MITAADADASPEICARRRVFPSPDEVVNGVEADQSHDDQIDRHRRLGAYGRKFRAEARGNDYFYVVTARPKPRQVSLV
jgi:hypothetical protein